MQLLIGDFPPNAVLSGLRQTGRRLGRLLLRFGCGVGRTVIHRRLAFRGYGAVARGCRLIRGQLLFGFHRRGLFSRFVVLQQRGQHKRRRTLHGRRVFRLLRRTRFAWRLDVLSVRCFGLLQLSRLGRIRRLRFLGFCRRFQFAGFIRRFVLRLIVAFAVLLVTLLNLFVGHLVQRGEVLDAGLEVLQRNLLWLAKSRIGQIGLRIFALVLLKEGLELFLGRLLFDAINVIGYGHGNRLDRGHSVHASEVFPPLGGRGAHQTDPEEAVQLQGRQLVAHDVEKLQLGESRSLKCLREIRNVDRALRQILQEGENRVVANDHTHLSGVVCQQPGIDDRFFGRRSKHPLELIMGHGRISAGHFHDVGQYCQDSLVPRP